MSTGDWIAIIGGAAALLTSLTALAVVGDTRRKLKSDAALSASQSVALLIDPLNTRITELTVALNKEQSLTAKLNSEMTALQAELVKLRGYLYILAGQVRARGDTPLVDVDVIQ